MLTVYLCTACPVLSIWAQRCSVLIVEVKHIDCKDDSLLTRCLNGLLSTSSLLWWIKLKSLSWKMYHQANFFIYIYCRIAETIQKNVGVVALYFIYIYMLKLYVCSCGSQRSISLTSFTGFHLTSEERSPGNLQYIFISPAPWTVVIDND